MTLRRAVVYVGGASLLVAWFSSAASLSLQRQRREPAQAPEPSPTEGLAHDVQAQTRRLRERLASAPIPQEPLRNPFVFRRDAAAPAASPRRFLEPVPPPLSVPEPAEPALTLIGIAEQRVNNAPLRIAMITTAGDELLMVRVGESVIQRYQVTAISSNAAELLDVTTGRGRRLVLQDQ